MKKPYLSVVIPAFNAGKTLGPLLNSIFSGRFKDVEVIVVDDASKDDTEQVARSFRQINLLRNKTNKGIGPSRNAGAKAAHGGILVFVDSDVVLYPDTLSEVAKGFRKTEAKALMGTYDWVPANQPAKLFHHFKAMRDWAYWTIDRNENYPVGGFGGAVAAITKELFDRVGGFGNLRQNEEQEMSWRINRVTKIVFNSEIKARHNFRDFWLTVKSFYFRTASWVRVYSESKDRSFVASGMNPREAAIAGLANLALFLLIASFFLPILWLLFVIVFGLRLFLGRRFLLFVTNKRGIGFIFPALFFSQALYLAVYLGAARVLLEKIGFALRLGKR